jgi:hypothetical protein
MAIALDGAPNRHGLRRPRRRRSRQINWPRLIALGLNLLVWGGVAAVVKAVIGPHH